MDVRARLKNYRVSPQKARLLANEIRGKGVEDALAILDLSPRRFSLPLAKLLRSALANAEDHNSRDKAGIDVDNLIVGTITVDQGARMWRIRARAQGRANWIQKKTSHIEVVLTEH
ncbi:MAG: 50S ribosomal protein L22 [Deltaproteobacteria bacterium]|nr:50S ribosomal protein L22 [Deltaproteobacteria bacterium]MBW2360506.1 50S ribosomal protein L22 [Deltaproteobacteria bacterium]